MPKTKTGKRTAHIQVQLVEEPDGSIRMYGDKETADTIWPPIWFDVKTGMSGPAAHKKLQKVLDLAGANDTDDS
jgi:hypothetical protein